MMKFLAIVFLVGVACANPFPTYDPGYPLRPIPYHVSIKNGGIDHCNGAIISENWVLTYCGVKSDNIINAGSTHSDVDGSIHNVSRIIKHGNVAFPNIALIQVEPPFVMDAHRQPIGLYESGETTPIGSRAFHSAYDLEHIESLYYLKTQELKTISKEECKKTYGHYAPEAPELLCANYFNSYTHYFNAEGGPVTVNGRLAGLRKDVNGDHDFLVYADIGSLRNWISEQSGV